MMGNLRFIDSLSFLPSTLDNLAKSTPSEKLKITESLGSELFKKGIYPYEKEDS